MKALSRFTLLLIGFALLTLPGNMGELLVCLGDAGHVAVVSPGAHGCHSPAPGTVSAGHDDCIDVTVTTTDGQFRLVQADRPALASQPATLNIAAWATSDRHHDLAPYRSPDWVATSPLLHRQTIVLLI